MRLWSVLFFPSFVAPLSSSISLLRPAHSISKYTGVLLLLSIPTNHSLIRAHHSPIKNLSLTFTALRAKSTFWIHRVVTLEGWPHAYPSDLTHLLAPSLHVSLTSLPSLPPMHEALPTSRPLHLPFPPECPSWGYMHTCSFSSFRCQDPLSLHLWSLRASYSNLWWVRCFLTSILFCFLSCFWLVQGSRHSCSLLCPPHLESSLAHSMCSISNYKINEPNAMLHGIWEH